MPKHGTGSMTTKLCQLYLLDRVCQDECVISQLWLKQSTAHKATLMYCLYWKSQWSNNTLRYFPITAAIPTTGHTLSPTKKAHILCLQKPQSWLVLYGCQEEHLCARQYTKLAFFFCFLLFYFLDNKLCDCLVRKWSFIPFLFPFIYFCLFKMTATQLRLPSTITLNPNPENMAKFIFWFHMRFRLVII